MEFKGMKTFFLILNILVYIVSTSTTKVDVADFEWGGVSAYMAVSRQAVQKKLDYYHKASPKAPKLFIPTDPVLPNLPKDKHVVYIDFGFVKSINFTNEPSVVSFNGEISVAIPLLSTSEDGPPNYALAIARMFQKKKGDIFKPQIIFQFVAVENVTIGDDGASMTNDNEAIHVTFSQTHPCQRADSKLMKKFDDYLLNDDIFSATSEPDLKFCDRHPEIAESLYCETMNDIKDDVRDALPNVCETHRGDYKAYTPCQVSMDVVSITPGLRMLLLLGKTDPIKVVAAEKYVKTFTSSLKYPCVTD